MKSLILLLPLFLFSAEDVKKDITLPSTVTSADKVYREAGMKLRDKYLADLQKIQVPVVQAYDKAIEEATKKGDLDTALALREKKKEFVEGEAVMNDVVGNFYTPKDRKSLSLGTSTREIVIDSTQPENGLFEIKKKTTFLLQYNKGEWAAGKVPTRNPDLFSSARVFSDVNFDQFERVLLIKKEGKVPVATLPFDTSKKPFQIELEAGTYYFRISDDPSSYKDNVGKVSYLIAPQ